MQRHLDVDLLPGQWFLELGRQSLVPERGSLERWWAHLALSAAGTSPRYVAEVQRCQGAGQCSEAPAGVRPAYLATPSKSPSGWPARLAHTLG
jgi:hypothetical protein